MGMIYKRGNVWWIKYYRNGKCYRESSGTTKKMVAKKLLDRREGDIARGKIPGIQFEKVTFDELAEEFLADYRINKYWEVAVHYMHAPEKTFTAPATDPQTPGAEIGLSETSVGVNLGTRF